MNQTMSEQHVRIEADHLHRMAYVYVRQSSLRPVHEHLESGRRQYERAEWAFEQGWLLAAVAGGEVGIVIALQVTRLARNSPDWHHLIYQCRLTGTLIADEHTVYDPALSADRMVLGTAGR
jgi:DNA invertase Pin-like site-specific DNA recombinase